MWRIRYAAKVAIASVLYRLGLLDLLLSRRLRGRAAVLMYHRVLAPGARAKTASHPGYIVSASSFARQMAVLKARFVVLSEAEFVDHLETGRRFADLSCLITFDDGWHDNLTEALPVLRQHGLPAVVYLPVHFTGTRRLFWREGLTHGLLAAIAAARRTPAVAARLHAVLQPHGLTGLLALAGDEETAETRTAVREAVQGLAHRRMEDDGTLLDELQRVLGLDLESLESPDRFLSWDDVRAMAAAGVTFGAHGAEHRLLGALPAAEAEQEIRRSQQVVAEELGTPVLGLSYPNGSVTPAVRSMAEAAGFRVAFTTVPGLVTAADDRFLVKRINIHDDMTNSTPLFLARIAGVF